MAQNLYITAMEPESGKSIASLGVLELLSGRVERLGFFRPVVPSDPDPQLELARDRYGLEAAHGLTHDEAISDKPYEVLRKDVVAAYKPFEANCDFVVCEGTDFVGAVPALDFGLNADLANELGAPVLVVVKGASSPEETLGRVGAAQGALRHKGCTIFGVLVNRVPPEHADGIGAAAAEAFPGDPIYVLPEHPELSYPTVAEAAEALGAEVLVDPRATLGREVRDVRVGAMSVEHFFDHLVEGALVLVPSDRPEVLLACLASSASQSVPTVAGVVLTGGYPLAESIGRLLEDAPFPVLQTPQQTHEATAALQTIRPLVRAGDDRKIAAALGLFESAVDTAELERRIAVERPERVTPIMFEYELIERARAEQAPHRAAGGRRRPRAARRRAPAAPRRRRPDGSRRARGRARPRGRARRRPRRREHRRPADVTPPRRLRVALLRAAQAQGRDRGARPRRGRRRRATSAR